MSQNKTCIMNSSRFFSEICYANANIPIILASLHNNYVIFLSKTHFFR